MFLKDIRKSVFNFIIWKFIKLKGVLTVIVFNNLINISFPNLMLAFFARVIFNRN